MTAGATSRAPCVGHNGPASDLLDQRVVGEPAILRGFLGRQPGRFDRSLRWRGICRSPWHRLLSPSLAQARGAAEIVQAILQSKHKGLDNGERLRSPAVILAAQLWAKVVVRIE